MKNRYNALQAPLFAAEALCLLGLAALLLCRPRAVCAGVAEGLRLCLTTLVGSLLPFLVLARLALLRGLHVPLARRGSFLTRRALGLPGVCAAPVAMSLIGGYPVGAAMTAQLLAQRQITPRQAQRLLLFAVSPGPAFAVSAVGAGLLGSARAGVVLWASVSLGALLCGVLTRPLLRREDDPGAVPQPPAVLPPAEALSRAAADGLQAMLLICAFAALFSGLLGLLGALSLPQPVLQAAAALLEVTNACGALCGKVSLPVIAAVLGWGGVCVHCQIAPFLAGTGLPFWGFVCGRLLHAGLSFGVCRALLAVVPLPLGTMAGAQLRPATGGNAALSVCMLAMCVLLLFPGRITLRRSGASCNSA
ncbi:MAG: hypothetical protein II804_06030 [Clostridia bacterium]|nr:hypothetical protein [Clostridia bacterium]